MEHDLQNLPLFSALANASRVLVTGAGGGFDVYAGLPLALALHSQGKQVHFANLTFSNLARSTARMHGEHLADVTAMTRGNDDYFPERTLAQWLASRGDNRAIHAFDRVGVQPLRAAYQTVCDRFDIDAVVLVDGGTDILMRGDEAGLGTPSEDMASLAAVAGLDVPHRIVACIGFGIDAHHGVSHVDFLENVAALERAGAFLGCFSVPRNSREGKAFLEAVEHAQARTPHRPSIVNGSIAAAMQGRFGDVRFTDRTAANELFINPLMSMYWSFDLAAVAARSLYLPLLEGTETIWQIQLIIEGFRKDVEIRPRRMFPH